MFGLSCDQDFHLPFEGKSDGSNFKSITCKHISIILVAINSTTNELYQVPNIDLPGFQYLQVFSEVFDKVRVSSSESLKKKLQLFGKRKLFWAANFVVKKTNWLFCCDIETRWNEPRPWVKIFLLLGECRKTSIDFFWEMKTCLNPSRLKKLFI